MDLKQILELLGQEHVPGDEMTGAFLEDAVASFAVNPTGATNSIRQLQVSDPPGFVLAAVRLLSSTEEKSPGVQYVAGLVFAGDLLIDALLDSRILADEPALALARNLGAAEPLLDVRLVRQMLANAAGELRAVKPESALRVLMLVEQISDCSRLSSYLVQMMRHPSPPVRSKVALLLGKSNFNLGRIKSFLASDDPRLRANAVESLWGQGDKPVITMLWEASKDGNRRVAINALVGLCKAGDRAAYDRLKHAAVAGDPVTRAGAAWAMGEIADAEFAETLEKLKQDEEPKVRSMAERSVQKLRIPEVAPVAEAAEASAKVDDNAPAPVTEETEEALAPVAESVAD
jgi:HEAT repeat protein